MPPSVKGISTRPPKDGITFNVQSDLTMPSRSCSAMLSRVRASQVCSKQCQSPGSSISFCMHVKAATIAMCAAALPNIPQKKAQNIVHHYTPIARERERRQWIIRLRMWFACLASPNPLTLPRIRVAVPVASQSQRQV